MLLSRERSQLLIVDVQEKLAPAIFEAERMIERCSFLMQVANRLNVPLTVSEQYRKGLGPTIARLNNLKGDAPVMDKLHFSCAADPALASRVQSLAAEGKRQVVLAGIEAHVCVLQSALGFKDMGLDVFVVADAVSSRTAESVALALERYRQAGVQAINAEMAMFEWLHLSGTPEFKDLSKLIR